MSVAGPVAAVVLAGGASRRFGSDKLEASLDGVRLLERVLAGLPADIEVVVVGPPRDLQRAVRFVREDPPGGGPAAAMVTGLRSALSTGATHVVVLPGDAPAAGDTATHLLSVLLCSSGASAVVGTDASGFDQPLQLALTRSAAEELVAAAGPDGAQGGSARALVRRLDPPAVRELLATGAHFDVDTPEQLRAWEHQHSTAVDTVLGAVDTVIGAVDARAAGLPVVVALDGRSGSGKSVLAAALALRRGVTVVHGDDFYSAAFARLGPESAGSLRDDQLADQVFDWRRLRSEALEPLASGQPADVAPYDWTADDGRLGRPMRLAPSGLIVLECVYSARPELADLVDLAVLVEVDPELRRRRLMTRPDAPEWTRLWERGESWYFAEVRRPASFDLRVSSAGG